MKKKLAFAMLLVLVATLFALPVQQQSVQTERISISNIGQEPNGESWAYTVSDDGAYVCFSSGANNLVANDTNNQPDCFVLNTATGEVILVSTDVNGNQGNFGSGEIFISGNGQFVVFRSGANNLVPNDTNNFPDLFVKDLNSGVIERISVSTSGLQANTGANSGTISYDGRYVAYGSSSSNLVGSDTNGVDDIFVRDRLLNTTTRISVSSEGTQANNYCDYPIISSDGRLVGFTSIASNLVDGDTNSEWDVFLRDTTTNTTQRVSLGDEENELNNSVRTFDISDNGEVIVFVTRASNVVSGDTNTNPDVFVRNAVDGSTVRISLSFTGQELIGGSGLEGVSISQNGRFVAYDSQGNNIVLNDTNQQRDVFRYDRSTNETVRVSLSSSGTQSNADCRSPYINKDGDIVTYVTVASTLIATDTNGLQDAYITYVPLPDPVTEILSPSGDSYLRSGQPNQNQGTEAILRVRQNGSNRSLVQFDQGAIASFVGNRDVVSAKLRLFITDNGNNWGASGRDVGAYRLTQAWTELGVTWNCPNDTNTSNGSPDGIQWEMTNSALWPFVTPATSTVLHTNGLSGWVEFDVTIDVQAFVDGSVSNFGWIIKKVLDSQGGSVEYSSKEGLNPPELVIIAQ